MCVTVVVCKETGETLMKSVIPMVMLLAGLAACVPKSELEEAKAQTVQLQAQTAQLQAQNEQLQQRVHELEIQVGAAGEKLTATEKQLTRRPALPVKVSFRPALMGPGLVALFETTTKDSFPILVSIKSKALGNTQQFRLNLNYQNHSSLGHLEGASIEAGDEITVENKNYESMTMVVSP